MRPKSRSWIVLALVLALGAAVAAPASASAQYDEVSLGIGIGIASLPSALVVGMAIADTVSFALGTPFDTALAVGDLVTGGITAVVSIIFLAIAINAAAQGHATDPVGFGVVGAIGLALGAYEIAHGIWSLASGGEPEPPPFALAPVPIPGGFSLVAGGTL